MLFDSGVFAWLRKDDPPRSSDAAGEFRHSGRAPLALLTLVVSAFVAAMGAQSMTEAPSASADASGTVEVETQHMPEANPTSYQGGSYITGDQLTSVCAKVNDHLLYQTSDGLFVADGNTVSGTVKGPAPECSSAPPGVDGEAAPVADAGRATGRTRGVNPGTEGQCTWGAAQKWFEASGSYPALFGDALSWNDAATAAGWTVTDDAQDRSIVVFEPGVAGAGSVGHVAWVDSVSQRADGRWIHVTEMNNSYLGGVGIFNDRDIMDVPGMSYILLP